VTAPPIFDPRKWLAALTEIGGGYALVADRRLELLLGACDRKTLATVMLQVAGRPDREEAIKTAIERRQLGEVA